MDFRSLVEQHAEKVRSICYRYVNNADDANDLAQEVFIQVNESLRHFRNESDVSTWIYRIAVNKSLDFLRRKKRAARLTSLLSFGAYSGTDEPAIPEADTPHQKLEEDERHRLLHRAIDGLPEPQKTALLLSKFEQYSNSEVAAIMDVSVPAVEAMVHRAKRNLRRSLEKYFRELR
jgi:RNA polymerase sigma-70 factor (ECF subfamily)